ncbi:MAG: hypothetical protein ACI8ZM_000303 [Crocinitomix sp.]|jgi:hypothetical protein
MKTTIFLILSFLSSQAISQSFYVPDDNFELILIDYGYDDVLDDSVLYSSVDWLGYLNVDLAEIVSLEGIEAFTSLETLLCSGNDIMSIDVSSNVNLKSLRISANNLTALDVSANVALEELICSSNNITSLDLSNNVNLQDLLCENNLLTSLDLSLNTELELVSLYYNELTGLDLNSLASLAQLDCRFNTISELDVSNNTELWELSISNNEIAEVDFSNNPNLIYLDCNYNPFTELDLTHNDSLKALNCIGGNVKNLNLDNNSGLESIHLEHGIFEGLSIQSGNNIIMDSWGHVFLDDNPLLTCVMVDDPAFSTTNWTEVDGILNFSLECDYSNVEEVVVFEFKVYPNPTTEKLNLETNVSNLEMRIYAISGEVLLHEKLNSGNNSIDVSALSQGVYLVQLIGNGQVYIEQIIVQ